MYQQVLYKPTKTFNGIAVNFKVVNDGCFMTLGKQKPGEMHSFDWKDDKGKHKHVVSLGLPDLGNILALLEGTVADIKLYHEFPKDAPKDAPGKVVTNILASKYSVGGVVKGYSFNITRNSEKLGFGLSFAEAECLKPLLREAVMALSVVELKANHEK